MQLTRSSTLRLPRVGLLNSIGSLDVLIVVLLTAAASILRFPYLGYSDYQGDEIKALYLFRTTPLDFSYFLDQRKGPLQFLIAWAMDNVSGHYVNQGLTRAPFALAGVAACIVFYLFVRNICNRRVALYASLFFVTNGFLVSFSRIVQYQSMVLLLMFLALYWVSRLIKTNHIVYLYLAMLAWALSFLGHYDAVFIAPMLLALLLKWGRQAGGFRQRVRQAAGPILLFVLLTTLFYVPFVLHLSSSTIGYWQGRITGSSAAGVPSSTYLFSVYQPIYGLQLYIILGTLGMAVAAVAVIWPLFRSGPGRAGAASPGAVQADSAGGTGWQLDLDPWFVGGLFLWFLVPFIFMEGIVSVPGTHTFTYLLPVMVFAGIALAQAEALAACARSAHRVVRYAYLAGVIVLAGFLFLQSYSIYVDHNDGYPWTSGKFLAWTLPQASDHYQLAMFGFPYYRHWREVGEYMKKEGRSQYFASNEKADITVYYVPLERDEAKAGYYAFVKGPQNFTEDIGDRRIREWVLSHEPFATFSNGSQVVTSLYFLPEPRAAN